MMGLSGRIPDARSTDTPVLQHADVLQRSCG